MNDEDTPGAEDGGEGFGREAGPRQTRSAGSDLPGIMEQFRQTSAWLTSVDKALEPARRHIRMLESARRTVESVMGPGTVYQVALDAQRQYRAVTEPVLALQSSLSDIYDWHSRINDVVRSVSLPRALLERLAATAALFLPANLGGLDTEELRTILEMGGDDGLSLAWAPRTGIVKALLPLGTRQERYALLAERRDDVLDDIDASLRIVTHPELTGMVAILSAATRTARAGFGEGAQALAGNVLESAMSRHGNAWIRRSFPRWPTRRGPGITAPSAVPWTMRRTGAISRCCSSSTIWWWRACGTPSDPAPLRTPSTATSERTRPRPTPTVRSSFCRRSSSPTPCCVR